MNRVSIGDHGIIGNMRSAALVDSTGRIDFFCFPEFDSASLFAALLDDGQEKAGAFSVALAGDIRSGTQQYLPETNVLLTRFLSDDLVVELCDFMPVAEQNQPHCIVRKVTAIGGRAQLVMRCRPAFDYGRANHSVDKQEDGVLFCPQSGSQTTVRLWSSANLEIQGSEATAYFALEEGESAYFYLGDQDIAASGNIEDFVNVCLRRTCEYWKRWARKSLYKGRWREAVTRSVLVLKLLTSRSQGSILAAPTFGLPETIGGERNWDYRFVWMRDASFTAYAFIRLGYVEEGALFERWLEGRLNLEGERGPLKVMYRFNGCTDLEEVELSHLSGYRGSKPVRIGNGAARQLQLDMYGELIDSVYLSSKYGDGIAYDGWIQMKAVLHWLADHWQDPDEGIWEVRGGKREFLHSRLMCWVAFDRAIRLGRKRSLAGPYQWMEDCRDTIVADIHKNFWNSELQSFVQYKGAAEVDASALLMPLVRFISPNDPRWLSTLIAIERDLVTDTVVKRYATDNPVDGLSGREAGFTACAFWLVEAKARSKQLDEAVALLEKLLRHANPVGLFAEQMQLTGEHLGNFPQALSHLALISAATYIDRCLDRPQIPTWS